MNKHRRGRSGQASSPLAGSRRSRRRDTRVGITSAHLPPEASRLLAALGSGTGAALVDPVDPARIIVQRARRGVSLGAGRFDRAAADALVRHDLARWSGTARTALALTPAGSAHLARSSADPDDAFRAQHGPTETVERAAPEGTRVLRVDAEESPLDWLRRRRGRDGEPLIDAASYEAGERLRRDITLAGMLPGVTARWEAPAGGPSAPGEATERMIAARQRLRHAFEALGCEFTDLLIDLCGFLKGLEVVERERGWPPRSAKVVVRVALRRLAEHYGLDTVASGPAASRGIRTWQAIVIPGGRAGP